MRKLWLLSALICSTVLLAVPASASGTYGWPVSGPILRGFDGGSSPYSAGHRGIDIGVPFGTPVLAAAAGTVSFAGQVAGNLTVSVDHAGGVRTTDSYLSAICVKKGQAVVVGQVVGFSGQGHPGSTVTHLHFSVRVGGVYVDPLSFLSAPDLSYLIRLAPAG